MVSLGPPSPSGLEGEIKGTVGRRRFKACQKKDPPPSLRTPLLSGFGSLQVVGLLTVL